MNGITLETMVNNLICGETVVQVIAYDDDMHITQLKEYASYSLGIDNNGDNITEIFYCEARIIHKLGFEGFSNWYITEIKPFGNELKLYIAPTYIGE